MHLILSRVLKIGLILLVICGILIALMPTVASTDWGRRQIVAWINKSIAGSIEIRTLDLRWMGGQTVEGLLLRDPDGHSVLEMKKFTTEGTLWQLILKDSHLGYTKVQDLNAALQVESNGKTNLQRALSQLQSPSNTKSPSTTTLLSDVNAEFYLFSKHHPLSASITGTTKKGKLNGSFDIQIAIMEDLGADWSREGFDLEQYLSVEGSRDVQLDAEIIHFPVDLLDQILVLASSSPDGFFHTLLGDSLNLSLQKEPSSEGLLFKLIAQSPLMKGSLEGQIAKGAISLQKPASVHLDVHPDLLFNFLEDNIVLTHPASLDLTVESLNIPLSFFDARKSTSPCQLELQAHCSLPKAELEIPQFGSLHLSDIRADVKSPECSQSIDFTLVGKSLELGDSFDCKISSTMPTPSNLHNLISEFQHNLQFRIEVSDLEVSSISPVFQRTLLESFGGPIHSQLEVRHQGNHRWDASLSIQTPKLQLKDAQFTIGSELTLNKPLRMDWEISQQFFNSLSDRKELMLAKPVHLQANLNKLQIPLKEPAKSKIDVEGSIEELSLAQESSWGAFNFQGLHAKVVGRGDSRFTSTVDGQLELIEPDGTISPILLERLAFLLEADIRIPADKGIQIPSAKLQLHNHILTAEVAAKILPSGTFELIKPLKAAYTLTPKIWELAVRNRSEEIPSLLEDTHLMFTLDASPIDVDSFSLEKLHAKGRITADHLLLQDKLGGSPLLQPIDIPWEWNAPLNEFSAGASGMIYPNRHGNASSFSSHIQLFLNQGRWIPDESKIELQLNFEGLPTSLAATALPDYNLSALIGPILDVNLKASLDPTLEESGYWDIYIDSQYLHAQARLSIAESLTLLEPEKIPTIRLSVSPDNFNAWKELIGWHSSLEMASTCTIEAKLSKLHIPLNEHWANRTLLDLHLLASPIHWKSHADAPLNLEGHLLSENLAKQLKFTLKATQGQEPLTLNGQLNHLKNSNGNWQDLQQIGLQLNAEGKHIDPAIFQTLFIDHPGAEGQIKAFLGSPIDLGLSCQIEQLTGPIAATVSGPQGDLQLQAQLNNGTAILTSPLKGSFNLTPLFIQTFLTPNAPPLSAVIGAEKPVGFSIFPESSSFPVFPFNLDQLNVGKGILDLGKIQFQNKGELSSVLNFIYPINDPTFTIWFTPLYFSIERGILNLKRIDLLVANRYTLASWGRINLHKEKGSLVLALSPQTLHYAFGITGLEDPYMFQIPLASSGGKLEIDKKRATARITALLAQTQGGTQGKIFGGILDAVLSQDGEIAPSPTTQPFPWKDEFKPLSTRKQDRKPLDRMNPSSINQEHKGSKKKKKSRKKEEGNHLLKGIEEGALQVLDQFIGQ